MNAIDQLGLLKAEIATLTDRAKLLEAEIKAKGVGAHAGELYDATVSAVSTDRLDMDAVREKLSPQFIRAHTITTESLRLSVRARKAAKSVKA